MSAVPTATPADAQLILQLYDLRREPEMRKARNWAMFKYQPKSAEDVMKIIAAPDTQENHWLRQVAGYWEMAASLVVRGALDRDLFVENSGEMVNFWVKHRPFLAELRQASGFPVFANIEQVIQASPRAQDWVARMEKRLAASQ